MILCLVIFPALSRVCPVPSVRLASQTTVDPDEVQRFRSLAGKWWDEQGEFAALHAMNDLRVPFVRYVYIGCVLLKGQTISAVQCRVWIGRGVKQQCQNMTWRRGSPELQGCRQHMK